MKSLLIILTLSFPFLGYAQLTGYWLSDTNGCYEIRQKGNEVWWSFETLDGQVPMNVFRGAVAGNNLTGIWCDLPSNPKNGCGESISLRVENNNRLVKLASSAPYNGSVWTRQDGVCKSSVCAFQLSNLPKKFKSSPSATKHSIYTRIGYTSQYQVAYFDGTRKYADRKEKVYRDTQGRLVLETYETTDGWICVLLSDKNADCDGSFDCRKSGQVSTGRYTIEIIEN